MARKTLGPRVLVYQGEDGDWYWRYLNRNRIMATAGEGYRRRTGCVKSLKSVMERLGSAQIIVRSNERNG